jgi:uncharacterized membrane protein (DUF441 family)
MPRQTDSVVVSLAAEGKYKLAKWMETHKADCLSLSASGIVKKVFTDIGLEVSTSSVNLYRKIVYPEVSQFSLVGGVANGGKMCARIVDLERRVAALEKEWKG